ncbi:MAG: hypothetical protein J3R72DRAFT_460337, partial [Linnemannia gamsii]
LFTLSVPIELIFLLLLLASFGLVVSVSVSCRLFTPLWRHISCPSFFLSPCPTRPISFSSLLFSSLFFPSSLSLLTFLFHSYPALPCTLTLTSLALPPLTISPLSVCLLGFIAHQQTLSSPLSSPSSLSSLFTHPTPTYSSRCCPCSSLTLQNPTRSLFTMGSFNTLYTFLSSRVLPQHHIDNSDNNDICTSPPTTTKSRHQRTFSDPMLPKETVQKLFPCDNRHSFNPHYQHNLHTTSSSTIYSTPPSLASSPTDSSPSSTISSSTHSHSVVSPSYTMTQATQKPFYQQPHPRRSQSSSSTYRQRQQQHQQQQQQPLQQQQHQYQRHYNSYSQQQARRLNQRNHASQQYVDNMDDDILIGYDNQQIYYGSGSSTSMARVHPNGSPTHDTHASMSSDRQHQYQEQQQQQQHNGRSGYISALSYPPRLSENERMSSPASRSLFAAAASAVKSSIHYGQQHTSQPKPQYPQQQQHQQKQQHQGRQQRRAEHARHQSASHFLPSISERRATMHMHEEEDVFAFDHASGVGAASASAPVSRASDDVRHLSASNSTSSLSSSCSSSSSSTPMTAKQSLLRIAQCDPRQDNWCSQQSGQWTRMYAQTRSNGPRADGRRTRRL